MKKKFPIPVGNHLVVVEVPIVEKSKYDLVGLDKAKSSNVKHGLIHSVGSSKELNTDFSIGDKVVYSFGEEFLFNGVVYTLVRKDNIIAIIG